MLGSEFKKKLMHSSESKQKAVKMEQYIYDIFDTQTITTGKVKYV